MNVYKNSIPLKDLPVGKIGEVAQITSDGAIRRRFLDLGLTPSTIVKTERISPLGNPIAFNIRGTVIALRKEEAANILVNILK